MKNGKGEFPMRHLSVRQQLSPFSFNLTSSSFPPYSLTLIKLRKSHLGHSSKLDCTRFGVGSPFSISPCPTPPPPTVTPVFPTTSAVAEIAEFYCQRFLSVCGKTLANVAPLRSQRTCCTTPLTAALRTSTSRITTVHPMAVRRPPLVA